MGRCLCFSGADLRRDARMTLDMPTEQAVIQTRNFDLRPLVEADAGMIRMYAGDARVAKFTSSIPHPLPPGTTKAFIARAQSQARDEDVWAMDATRTGGPALMGLISIRCLDRAQCEFGYWVAPAFWNGGIASEAVAALVAANPKGCDTFFAEVFQDNPASAKLLTNQGFEYVGDSERFSVARDANVPTWTYLRKG